MAKQKCLITGSGGFILGNFIRQAFYEKRPYDIVSVDKITKSNALNNIAVNRDHNFFIGDITNQHFVDILFEYQRPDIVIHGAALTHVDDAFANPNDFVKNNVMGTQVIINACVKWNVQKLLYVSTDEVYGTLHSDSDPSWPETATLDPRNPYSASKASGELFVKAAAARGLNYNIVRSSNNYGPRQTAEKLLPKIIKCILNNQKIPVHGQGLQMRDWLHVRDNCSGFMLVLDKGQPNETYNIAANQECSVIELIQKVCNLMGKGHDLIEFVEDPRGTGQDFRYALDTTKIRSLGWEPKVKLPDGLAQTIDWYLANQWFLR